MGSLRERVEACIAALELLLPLRQPRLAQAFDDASVLRIEGRIVAPMNARPCLNGEVGIDFSQLRHGLLGFLSWPAQAFAAARSTNGYQSLESPAIDLLHEFDRLFPLGEMGVEVADVKLP